MRNFLFKLLFPRKFKQLEILKVISHADQESAVSLREENGKLRRELITEKKKNEEITLEEVVQYCMNTLGIPWIQFSEVDEDGKPPHYLEGLSESERKDFIAKLESIYTDDQFQTVISYVINLIGNFAIQKADDDQMKNGKIGIIGIRTLLSEFIEAHQEYVDSKKPVEGFDPLATLPE